MCAMVGADVEQLRETATRMASAGRALETIERDLTARLNSAIWVGDAGDRFRYEWNSGHRARLVGASAALRAACDELLAQATQQDDASNSLIGGGTPDVGGKPFHGQGPDGLSLDDWLEPGLFLHDLMDLVTSFGVAGAFEFFGDGSEEVFPQVMHNPLIAAFATTGDIYSAFQSGLDIGEAILAGDSQGIFAGVVDVASLLAGSGSISPQSWLASAAIDVWGLAAETALYEVDWSAQGMSYLWTASADDWADSFGDACDQVFDAILPWPF